MGKDVIIGEMPDRAGNPIEEAERRLLLRVFGCLPDLGAMQHSETGVRKASGEETAGEFAVAVVSVYGDLMRGSEPRA